MWHCGWRDQEEDRGQASTVSGAPVRMDIVGLSRQFFPPRSSECGMLEAHGRQDRKEVSLQTFLLDVQGCEVAFLSACRWSDSRACTRPTSRICSSCPPTSRMSRRWTCCLTRPPSRPRKPARRRPRSASHRPSGFRGTETEAICAEARPGPGDSAGNTILALDKCLNMSVDIVSEPHRRSRLSTARNAGVARCPGGITGGFDCAGTFALVATAPHTSSSLRVR